MNHARTSILASVASALALCAGCAGNAGTYVWARDLPPGGDPGFAISPGDLLVVRVWNDDALGGRARVRSDGRISLPFVNDVAAAGLAPHDLARALEMQLAGYVNGPRVTVALEEERRLAISVVGEVARPGVYDLPAGTGVLQALASAGGTTAWARDDRIFVLRPTREGGPPLRIRFTRAGLSRAEDASASFRLRRDDVVVVE